MRRSKMSKGKSQAVFKHTAKKMHSKNIQRPTQRGGIKL